MTLCGRTKQHFHLHTDRFRIHRRTDPIGQADFFGKLVIQEIKDCMTVPPIYRHAVNMAADLNLHQTYRCKV